MHLIQKNILKNTRIKAFIKSIKDEMNFEILREKILSLNDHDNFNNWNSKKVKIDPKIILN